MRSTLSALLLALAGTGASTAATAQQALWKPFDSSPSPTPRWDAPMVYDSARDRMVMIGGVPGTSAGIAETWEHDGANWSFRGAIGPSGAQGHIAAAYDSARQRTVVVQNDFPNLRVWEWDGVSWAQQMPAIGPAPRVGFALAYDAARGVTLLFGGRLGSSVYYAETWQWDGVAWQQVGSGGPYPRIHHKMVYDAANEVVVLFGGVNENVAAQYGDTWEWNGAYWLEHFGVPGPLPRSEHAMAYDASRQRTVMVGGRRVYGGSTQYTDTWEWDGIAWHATGGVAPAPSGLSLAYDGLRQRTLAFGGRFFLNTVLDDTDLYTATSVAASVTAYGAGCPGPGGTPQLFVQSGSAQLGSTLTVRLNTMQTGLLDLPLLWLGYDDQQWNGLPLPLPLDGAGFPGCTALLAPVAAYALGGGPGYGTWSTSLPFLPQFLGFEFYLQGGVLVLGFNPGGLVFSNGLHGVVGG